MELQQEYQDEYVTVYPNYRISKNPTDFEKEQYNRFLLRYESKKRAEGGFFKRIKY